MTTGEDMTYMTADTHIHTYFSADSEADPREEIEQALQKGADVLCFTDHMDYDFGDEGQTYTFDPERYCAMTESLKEEYKGSALILTGVEFGMQPHLAERYNALVSQYPFDFVLGSQHLVYGKDPYYPDVFSGRSDKDVIGQWFRELKESLTVFPSIDSLAHIDYIFRYVQDKDKIYPYEQFEEEIGDILSMIIQNGISLEINSGGFRKIRCIPHFHEKLLHQYRLYGGKSVTTGSDAHRAEDVLNDYDTVKSLLRTIPGLHYTYYEKRIPKLLEL